MNMTIKYTVKTLSCLLLVLSSFVTSVTNADEMLFFSAPPRESKTNGVKTYAPIAKYLTEVTGKKVVYQHPGNWPNYTSNMRHNKYDFVFDGPHFVSWRIKHLNHRAAIKIPGDFVFAFISKRNNPRINRLNDLIARKVCGHAPPNQGTLRLFHLLDNPVRQPRLVAMRGWKNIFNAMMEDKCDVAIIPLNIYRKLDPNKVNTKVIFMSRPASGQAITVSPHLSNNDFKRIRSALLDEKGQVALKNLQSRFASQPLIAANSTEYKGIHNLLKYSYGFDAY